MTSTRNARSALLLVLASAVAAAVPNLAAAQPWHQGDASGLALYGDALVDIASGDTLADDFNVVWDHPAPVVGRPDLLFSAYVSDDDAPRFERGMLAEAWRILAYTQDQNASQAASFPPDNNSQRGSRFVMLPDLRRVIELRDGDFWRGDFDWDSGEAVNQQRVTDLGAFSSKPVVVTGNVALVYGGFDEAKPWVKIDMVSGDIEEIGRMGVLPDDPRGFRSLDVTPSGSHVVRFEQDVIRILDLRTDTVSLVGTQATFQMRGREVTGPLPIGRSNQRTWITDRHMFFAAPAAGITGILDVDRAQIALLTGADAPSAYTSATVTPGAGFVHLRTPTQPDRVVSLTDASAVSIEIPDGPEVFWINDDFAQFFRNDGGLSARGTYLIDRAAGTVERITPRYAFVQGFASLPDGDALFIEIQDDGTHRLDLVTRTLTKLGEFEVTTFGEPVELGFSGGLGTPWQPIDTNATLAAEAAALEAAGPPTFGRVLTPAPGGLIDVLSQLVGESDELIAEAERVYSQIRRQSGTTDYYSPAAATMLFVEARRASPDANQTNLVASLDWSRALDRDATVATIAAQHLATSANRDTDDAKQRAQRIAERAFEILREEHPSSGALRRSAVSSAVVRATNELRP